MTTINERTTSRIQITFVDFDGDPAQPTAATWRLDDLTSGESVVAETALTPTDGVAVLTIPPSAAAILTATNRTETRRLTVVAEYGSSDDQVTEEMDFEVRNLRFVP